MAVPAGTCRKVSNAWERITRAHQGGDVPILDNVAGIARSARKETCKLSIWKRRLQQIIGGCLAVT